MFVPQQRDFGLNPAFAGKSSQTLPAHDPVAGNNDRYRVCATQLADGLGGEASGLGEVARGGSVSVRDRTDLPQDRLKRVRPYRGEGKVENSQRAYIIGSELRYRFFEKNSLIRVFRGLPFECNDSSLGCYDLKRTKLCLNRSTKLTHRDKPG